MRRRRREAMLLFLILPLLFSHNYASAQPLASSSDRTGLFLLRSSLGIRSKDWPRRSDPCSSWLGLTCKSGRVTGLNLSPLRRTRRSRLAPRFAIDGLQNLTRLESLNSTGFALPGPIPAWLGRSASLSSLTLRSSKITGEIPPSLIQLRNLTLLDLSSNSLTGPVPVELGFLRSLKTLTLADNSLSGSIPDAIFTLRLDTLNVSYNNLTGTLPESMRLDASYNATSLAFDLSNNRYYGSVSAPFGLYLRRFRFVDLSDNYFQGTVLLDATNADFGSNCFRNVSGQRNVVDCEEFYKEKGLAYDPDPSAPSGKKKKKQTWKYILAGVLGAVGLVVVTVILVLVCLMRNGARTVDRGSVSINARTTAAEEAARPPSRVVSKNSPIVGEVFTYEQLVRATSGFSAANLIKKGLSGEFYCGVLDGGFSVAVKRVDLSVVRTEWYDVELDIFARALHTRMVPFLGQCSEKENDLLLVYKYMIHGDLSGALYRKPKQDGEGFESLDWITRLKIAIGVAEALCFLHHECSPPLVHRDIQASSILLDDKFEVRLGSLSKVCTQEGEGHQNVFTRFLRRSKKSEEGSSGTPPATCAYDIYCFGKVLLELVTGKLGISEPNNSASASEWLDHISVYDKESVSKIVDPSLVLDEDFLEEAWAMAIMAKSCLNPKPSKRPLARHVLKALENPLKVVRVDSRMNTARLATTSSRGSWHGALFGSWRQSSSDIVPTSGPLREDRSLRRSGTRRSHESIGNRSSSRKRGSKEIFPEPMGEAGDIEG